MCMERVEHYRLIDGNYISVEFKDLKQDDQVIAHHYDEAGQMVKIVCYLATTDARWSDEVDNYIINCNEIGEYVLKRD